MIFYKKNSFKPTCIRVSRWYAIVANKVWTGWENIDYGFLNFQYFYKDLILNCF